MSALAFRLPILRRLSVVLALIPPLLVVLYIAQNGRNVPYADEWRHMTNMAIDAADGHYTLADFYSQHDTHRMFFGKLLTAILAQTTGWNLPEQMMFHVIVTAGVLALLLVVLRGQHPAVVLLALVPTSALLFSLRQAPNWIWAVMLNRSLMNLFFVAALVVLAGARYRWPGLVAGALLAFCAAISFLEGLAAWAILVIPVVFIYRQRRYVIFWLAAGVLIYVAFFTGYRPAVLELPPDGFDPLLIATYMLAYLGSPLAAGSVALAVGMALLGIALFAANLVYLRRRGMAWSALSLWIALALFPVAAAALTAIGRSHIVFNPLAVRYVAVPSLLWLALVAVMSLSLVRLFEARENRWLKRGNLAALGLFTALYVGLSYFGARLPVPVTDTHVQCVLNYPTTRETACLDGLDPLDNPRIPAQIERLADHNLTIFSGES